MAVPNHRKPSPSLSQLPGRDDPDKVRLSPAIFFFFFNTTWLHKRALFRMIIIRMFRTFVLLLREREGHPVGLPEHRWAIPCG